MSAAKKQHASNGSKRSPKGIFWLLGPGRSLLMFSLVFGLFAVGAYVAWRHVQPRVLASPENLIGVEQIAVTTPPWIHSDIRADVVRSLKLGGDLNIMDDELINRVTNGFAGHPWVAQVVKVVKQNPPPLVKVELAYRKPVCVVAVSNDPLPLPIDADSVLLPRDDFTGIELTRYPRLVGVDRSPPGFAPGQRWIDPRVIGGAEIAAVLLPVWDELKLQSIQPIIPKPAVGEGNGGQTKAAAAPATAAAGSSVPGNADRGNGEKANVPGVRPTTRVLADYEFQLVSAGNTPIYWGYAPGSRHAGGEWPPADKVTRLQRFVSDHGSLDLPNRQMNNVLRPAPP